MTTCQCLRSELKHLEVFSFYRVRTKLWTSDIKKRNVLTDYHFLELDSIHENVVRVSESTPGGSVPNDTVMMRGRKIPAFPELSHASVTRVFMGVTEAY